MAFLSVYLFFCVVCFIFYFYVTFCVFVGSHFNIENVFKCEYGQQVIFILVIDEEAELGGIFRID